MRTLSRTALAPTVAMLISLVLALPASAAQLIEYRGETSAPSYNRVSAYVLKKDNGRRFLRFIAVRSVLTCEDATTFTSSLIIGIGRLSEDGSFSRVIDDIRRVRRFSNVCASSTARSASDMGTARTY